MSEMHLVFNGINGATGDYDLPPMTGEELASVIQHLGASENAKELRFHHLTATEQTHGLKEGLDPKKLDEAGWGIVFAHDADPGIEEALADPWRSAERKPALAFASSRARRATAAAWTPSRSSSVVSGSAQGRSILTEFPITF